MRSLGLGRGCALAPPLPHGPQADLAAGVLPAGAVLARASAASRVTAAGSVAFAPADAARFDHDPATGRRRGLLVEPARTNLLVRSTALTDPAWQLYRDAAVAGGGIGPDGAAGAAVVALGAAGIASFDEAAAFYQPINAATPGTRYVASLWVRAAAGTTAVRLGFFRGGGPSIDTGDVAVSATRWTRLAVGGVALAPGIHLSLRNGVAGSGAPVIAWGGQIEEGEGATSLIATADAPAMRAADLLTIDWRRQGVGDGPATWRCFRDGVPVEDVAGTVANGVAPVPASPVPLIAVRLVAGRRVR